MIRLFHVFFPRSVIGLLLSEFLLVSVIVIAAIFIVLPDDAFIYLAYEGGVARATIVVLSVLLGMYFQDLYTHLQVRSITMLFQQVILTVGVVFLTQAFVSYVSTEMVVGRSSLLVAAALLIVLLPLWRILYTRVIYKGLGIERLLLVGDSALLQAIATTARDEPALGFRISGILRDGQESTALPNWGDVEVGGGLSDLRSAAAKLKPDRIVVGVAERRAVLPVYELLDLRFAGVRIEDATVTYEAVFGRVPIQSLRPSQLIFSSDMGPHAWNLRLQQFLSFIMAVIGLVVTLPLMVIVAVAVRLTSPGPTLYRQTRVGLRGKPFTILKFRSMRADAEQRSGAVWATKNDPRITPIGRIIRKTRLDELPQLINILRGEMSVVGPRPERPEFVATLSEQIPFYPQRHCVKPGLTGWAQINYKYGDTLEDTVIKLEYDLYYIKNLSVALDVYIMFHTLKTMLLRRGAN